MNSQLLQRRQGKVIKKEKPQTEKKSNLVSNFETSRDLKGSRDVLMGTLDQVLQNTSMQKKTVRSVYKEGQTYRLERRFQGFRSDRWNYDTQSITFDKARRSEQINPTDSNQGLLTT